MKVNIFIIILIIYIIPQIYTITDDISNDLNDIRYIKSHKKINITNIINNAYNKDAYEDIRYSTNINTNPSILNFFKEIYNSLFSYNLQEVNNYITGLKEILSVFKDIILFNKRKPSKNIYNNIIENNSFKIKGKYSNDNNIRKLEEITIKNNTDLRDKTVCQYDPYLDSKIYIYICNNTIINKAKYEELKNNTINDCKFYIMYDYICICPINTAKCTKNENIYCTFNTLQCNNNNLLEGYNTFYEEYQKKSYLKYSDIKYNFNIGINCFTVSKNTTVNGSNFDIVINNDYDFDIISTKYKNSNKSQIQYTKKDILNKTTKIFDYYNYDNKMIIFNTNFKLYCKFSIYDVKWLIPVKEQIFNIPENYIKNIMSGNQLFSFDIIIDDILNNNNRTDLYNFTHLSDLSQNNKDIDTLYFEISIYSNQNNIICFNYIGDINLLK